MRTACHRQAPSGLACSCARPQGVIQMVSAVEMSPEVYLSEIPGSYGEACVALGVAIAEGSYGLVLDQDEAGARWTRVTLGADHATRLCIHIDLQSADS
jgi:hypothetical protein